MRLALPLLLALSGISPSLAQELPREVGGPVLAHVVKVRDGDTIEVEALIWPMQTVQVAVRLRGVDAPELKGACAAETAAARDARDRLATLVGAGPVWLTRVSGDKYFGRVLADVATSGESDLGARLLREGLVDAYDGGRRRDWCATVGARREGAGAGRG
ncbi:thermonuclease family protein [Aureimonas sp. Leaf324]|uniref:thermonuclease family protein n=1 Tax=Aureimonas sp. Leaf324 TaxID=1736336 RepID=UPI0006F43EB8|nr:thermonuclease family protein [Aureimonas sp. Leaf324]KQQ89581.1 nuclease [Aureimonas sp. Leaf324]